MLKKQILFVDDEPNVLQGLQRMLRSMRDQWDVDTASSGEEALQKLAQHPYDVIVTDMRMPGMDGAELLLEVMKTYPHIVRIVLSGQSDQESVLRAIGSTHQYLSKPCDAEMLKATVNRACALHQILEDPILQQLISKLNSLPSMPTLYTDIMREIRSEDPSIDKIGRIIGRDPAMTAKILQLVNSAFFGFYKNVQDPSRAVMVLGLDKVRSLILTIHIFSEFSQSALDQFNINDLWQHNLYVGECARTLAQQEEHPQSFLDECYMAGLLHDVGKLVLMANLPDKYQQALTLAKEKALPLVLAEKEIFGASHAEVGAYLLGLWGLPAPIIEAIVYHHTPQTCPDILIAPLTFVHAANALVRKLSSTSDQVMESINSDYLNLLGLDKQIESWSTQCHDLVKEEASNE